ncbi:E3 binding domain-containing protein [Deinococcus sp.]|uniref:E3 binding domain-containing protein n=1 Tax=Deinococcus sp. TaxID=47478 RepID=UPI003CC639E1
MNSISPLAKILAEANGIDWRGISGSGDGGTIVEQDILNYLSRIMSGDEEPPATPVDEAPPGWTGQMPPMPVMGSAGLQALSAAGVESDITDFVAQHADVRVAPVSGGAVNTVADEMDFELDDAPEVMTAPAVSLPPAPQPASPVPQSDVRELALPAAQTPTTQTPAAQAEAAASESGQPATGFGLGGFLSRLYRKPASETEPSAPASTSSVPAQTAAPQPSLPTPALPIPAAPPELPTPAVPAATAALEVDALEPATQDDAAELDHGRLLDGPTAPMQTGHPAPGGLGSFVPAAQGMPLEQPQAAPLPEQSAPEIPVPEIPVPEIHIPDAPAQPPVAAQAPQTAPAPAVSASPVPAIQAPAGVSLRLNASVAALLSAQSQVSEALGQSVPLNLLVGRAAARSLGTLGLSGQAALADASGQALAAELSGDLRASLSGLSAPTEATAALLILDAAALGLDELHLGARSLSLGRSEDGRAALSLRGDLDAVRGAKFLHEVAALLETPIKLLF